MLRTRRHGTHTQQRIIDQASHHRRRSPRRRHRHGRRRLHRSRGRRGRCGRRGHCGVGGQGRDLFQRLEASQVEGSSTDFYQDLGLEVWVGPKETGSVIESMNFFPAVKAGCSLVRHRLNHLVCPPVIEEHASASRPMLSAATGRIFSAGPKTNWSSHGKHTHNPTSLCNTCSHIFIIVPHLQVGIHTSCLTLPGSNMPCRHAAGCGRPACAGRPTAGRLRASPARTVCATPKPRASLGTEQETTSSWPDYERSKDTMLGGGHRK